MDGFKMLGNTQSYGYDCGKEIHERPGALDDWGTLLSVQSFVSTLRFQSSTESSMGGPSVV